jgi:hypothetical protein
VGFLFHPLSWVELLERNAKSFQILDGLFDLPQRRPGTWLSGQGLGRQKFSVLGSTWEEGNPYPLTDRVIGRSGDRVIGKAKTFTASRLEPGRPSGRNRFVDFGGKVW